MIPLNQSQSSAISTQYNRNQYVKQPSDILMNVRLFRISE